VFALMAGAPATPEGAVVRLPPGLARMAGALDLVRRGTAPGHASLATGCDPADLRRALLRLGGQDGLATLGDRLGIEKTLAEALVAALSDRPARRG
jgi:hypothetical protein